MGGEGAQEEEEDEEEGMEDGNLDRKSFHGSGLHTFYKVRMLKFLNIFTLYW